MTLPLLQKQSFYEKYLKRLFFDKYAIICKDYIRMSETTRNQVSLDHAFCKKIKEL